MKLLENTLKIVVIVIEILFFHMNMNLLASHADSR